LLSGNGKISMTKSDKKTAGFDEKSGISCVPKCMVVSILYNVPNELLNCS